MARTSLLVALALAAAPFTAQALGVTKPYCGDCPAKSVEEGGDTFDLPNGTCGARYYIECAGYFACEISEWEFVAEPPSCDDSDVACNDRNGDWNPPLAGECCGTCSIPPK